MIEHNEITLEKRNQSKVVRTFALPRQVTQQPEKSQQKFMIIANGIFYNGVEAEKVYLGENLVWEKAEENEYPDLPFNPKDYSVWGRFADESGYMVSSIKLMCTNTEAQTYQATSPVDENGYFAAVLPEAPAEFQPARSGMSFVENYGIHLGEFHTVNWDTSKLTSLDYFLSEERLLTTATVNNINTSEVTTMIYAFRSCQMLEELDLSNWDTRKTTSMQQLFYNNFELRQLNISGWDFNKVTDLDLAFSFCRNLTTVLGPITGIGASWTNTTNLDLHDSPLTNASAMVFINGLAEVTEAKTIQFKASTYDTLTPEQIAVATSKGWNVVRR